MRKLIISILLNCIPLCVFADYNGMGFKTSIGYHDVISLPTKKDNGIATTFNLLYEYNKRHFILQIGGGIHYGYLCIHQPTYQGFFPNMKDADGDICKYGYSFVNRQDVSHIIMVDAPILFGGKWNQFFFLVGGKLQYSLVGHFSEKALLNTWGEYENLIEKLEDMPNHHYFNQTNITAKQQFNLPIAISASTEIGIDLSALSSYSLLNYYWVVNRISIFADCAINNLVPPKESNLYNFYIQGNEIEDIQLQNITMQHCYKAKNVDISALRFWEVGIRYTLIFAFPTKDKTCRCVKN